MPLSPGAHLGPYEILAPLGAGGMGEVYRARDPRLGREVAIKTLPPHLSSSPEARQRFEREAKTISQLSHPHICALYDVGHEGETEYLVMELLDGETLAERLAKGPLPLEHTLRFGVQIADALDRAHRVGIVHRDLKPGNVMLTKSGVKLLDFGLAKFSTPTSGPISGLSMLPTTPKASNLTAEGTILGTFQYMAPEQLEGKEADARTDIFALGAVLYEMATGKKAFAGASQASLISSIMTKDPEPISSTQPMSPPALDRVVRTCLAKDPEDRWQSAGDVAKELKWLAEGSSLPAGLSAPSAGRKRREIVAWLVAAAAVAGLAAVSIFSRRPHTETSVARSFLLPPEKMEFETSADNCASLTISPDGRNVTFAVRDAEGKTLLWLRSLDALSGRPIPGTEGASFPFWSPDSRSLAFFAGGQLKRVEVAGGPSLAICDAPNGRSGSWNRNGIILFSPNTNTEVFQVPAAGGTPTPATRLDVASSETTHRWPAFLPDGKHFLYTAGSHSEGTKSTSNAIYLASLGSTERTRILQGHSNVAYASGCLLSVRDHVLLAQPFDLSRGHLTGEPVPLADGVQNETSYFRGGFSVSDNGILIYATGTSGTNSRLRRLDIKTGQPSGEPFGDPAEYRELSVSTDDSRIAATIADPSTGLPEIWLVDARGARAHFTSGGPAFSPVFSPDGTRIAYARAKGIFVKP
ncbi:MAG TPA: protein kinase, partial [Thermoanaerobaculia bacterium]|nr:protein kinase [Thermoanaerobaculia bacterium]